MKSSIYYGLAELGIIAIEIILRVQLMYFYVSYLKIPATFCGLAFSAAMLIDAFWDPYIGRISDQLFAKNLNRISLMILGSVVSLVSFAFLFNPPAWDPSLLKWYFLILIIVQNIGISTIGIPHAALVGDFSLDEKQQSGWIASKTFFGVLGSALGMVAPKIFLKEGADANAFSQMSFCILALCLLSFLPTLFYFFNRSGQLSTQIENKLNIKMVMKMPVFYLLIAFFIFNVGLTINTSLAIYFYQMKLGLTLAQTQTILLTFFMVFIISVPFWFKVSNEKNSLGILLVGTTLLGLVALILYPLLPPGEFLICLSVASVLAGILMGSSSLIEKILTYEINKINSSFKVHSYGQIFGLWKLMGKLARSFALGLSGFWLDASLADTTGTKIGWLFGPSVGIFILLSMICVYVYHRKSSVAQSNSTF